MRRAARPDGSGAQLWRAARIVETDAGPVVRFAPECGLATGACGQCGAGRQRDIPLAWLTSDPGAAVGEQVQVAVNAWALTRVAARLFVIPLMALLAAAWLAAAVAQSMGSNPDVAAGLAGLAALALCAVAAAGAGRADVQRLRLTLHRHGNDS